MRAHSLFTHTHSFNHIRMQTHMNQHNSPKSFKPFFIFTQSTANSFKQDFASTDHGGGGVRWGGDQTVSRTKDFCFLFSPPNEPENSLEASHNHRYVHKTYIGTFSCCSRLNCPALARHRDIESLDHTGKSKRQNSTVSFNPRHKAGGTLVTATAR